MINIPLPLRPPPSDHRGLCSPSGSLRQHNLRYRKLAIPLQVQAPDFPIGTHSRALRDNMHGCEWPSALRLPFADGIPCPPVLYRPGCYATQPLRAACPRCYFYDCVSRSDYSPRRTGIIVLHPAGTTGVRCRSLLMLPEEI